MNRLLELAKKSRHRLLSMSNVAGVGVGYKQVGTHATNEPAVIVFVEKKVPRHKVRAGHAVPFQIEGVDTDVVEIGKIKLLQTDRQARIRPVRPGVSIGHYRVTAGTLGAVVRDRSTGKMLILSNNHILANGTTGFDSRATKGDPIFQPGSYDGGGEADRIGTLYRFVGVFRAEEEALHCPVAQAAARNASTLLSVLRPDYRLKLFKAFAAENTVDCALALPDSPNLVDPAIVEIGPVRGMAEVKPNETVKKSGRTTGLTTGRVIAVGTSLKVAMENDQEAWFGDQVVTDMKCGPGDSGSLVLNGNNQAVGLLFAGSEKYTIFNRIQNVIDALQVDFPS
ncbi:MAG: hypothetical protein M0Z41_02660 [Peptococcaceae bacterium]|jgi:hypothetical protein|nr:hypothetical protein [Peptococcaceae bacterium]